MPDLIPIPWSERLLRTRAQMLTLIDDGELNYPGFYIISNAVAGTLQLQVWAKSDSELAPNAVNMTTGDFGTYDIDSDVFTPLPSGGFDYTLFDGWDENNPNLILQPVGDGSTDLKWVQNA